MVLAREAESCGGDSFEISAGYIALGSRDGDSDVNIHGDS